MGLRFLFLLWCVTCLSKLVLLAAVEEHVSLLELFLYIQVLRILILLVELLLEKTFVRLESQYVSRRPLLSK